MAMSDDATTNDTALRHWLLTHQYALLNPLVIEQTEWQDLPHRVLIPPQVDVRPHLLPRLILLGQLDGTERLQLASRIERHRRRGRPTSAPCSMALQTPIRWQGIFSTSWCSAAESSASHGGLGTTTHRCFATFAGSCGRISLTACWDQ